ncbi:hypothetical protein ACIBJE_29265 [Micromonospora sp. NPDC050187]|uniref:hypothetical protein n=1 Tax=Micromonospora sp. NPDC050187 TaxID=3364277 RepID=UPI0037BCAF00
MRRAAITSPSAPTPGRHAPPGSAGWICLARAAVLVVTGVGAALLAVALSAAPARAETGEDGGNAGRLADVVSNVRQPGRGEMPAVSSREPTAVLARVPLWTARPAVGDRKQPPVAPARPAPTSPATGETAPSRPPDREIGTGPRPEPLVPRLVSRILPPRPAPPLPDPPVDGPASPPASAPPGTSDGSAPAPVTTRPRPSAPVTPPRPVPDDGPANPVPDDGPAGPVDGPAARPAPDDPASPPGRIPLPPRLVGMVDGALRPILDLLTDVLGGVLAPILDLPGGGCDPPLPPGPVPPAGPTPTPVPDNWTERPPVPDPQARSPRVHNGGPFRPGQVGSGETWSPVGSSVPGHRAAPAAPTLDSGSASGDPSEAPGSPGDDRVSGDSGPRAGAALPPETSGPARSDRDAFAEVPPAPARGRSPTVAARPG